MERSSRFLSLSGLSGVFIGLYALAGAVATGWYVNLHDFEITSYYNPVLHPESESYLPFLNFFIGVSLIVLFLSLLTGYIFTKRLTKKQGLNLWDNSAKRLLVNLLLPLITGGLFCLILLHHNYIALVAPAMLIFYGLSLLNASKYTHDDIRCLGVIELILGLISAIYTGYGLLFWAFGFGVLHIIYGITMYFKYER